MYQNDSFVRDRARISSKSVVVCYISSSMTRPFTPLPASLRRRLGVLSAPPPDLSRRLEVSFSPSEFQSLILWLEEESIRLWTPAERLKLRDKSNQAKWFKTCREYLSELGLDAARVAEVNAKDGAQTNRLWVADVLISMAVHDEYQDRNESGEIDGSKQEVFSIEDEDCLSLSSPILAQLIAPLNRLLEGSNLPLLSGEGLTEHDVAGAVRLVRSRLCVDVDEEKNLPEITRASLEKMPTGFDHLQEKNLKLAGVLLRLLHNSHMREFQAKVNETINRLQQFTADPKTDSKLGRVGR